MIKFGTDGWRAVISDEFTFENVRKVARAIALYLAGRGPLIVGYDSRFLADKFAEEVVKVMEEAGIDCLLTERDTPTPIVAWSVIDKKAAGAVMLTASHNPAEYCGIKFIPHYAGPATESITSQLQENSNQELDFPGADKKGRVERFEPRQRYSRYIESFVDLDLIRRAKLKIVYDPMHGSGRGYLDRILPVFETIHAERDVMFGGNSPEPSDEHLGELKKKVLEFSADAGLANDGDADRFGVVDEKGKFLHPNQVLPLLFYYLVKEKGYSGAVVRSVATTHLIDRIAKQFKVKVYETPVGFKYIAELMMKEDIIIGGEESGGLSIKGHIPEKDGILAGLLVVEMLARWRKALSKIWEELVSMFGETYNTRLNLSLDETAKNKFMEKLQRESSKEIAGIKIEEMERLDGVKILLVDGSWVLARPSGTEPLVRIYAESDRQEKLAMIVESVEALL